MSGSRNLMTDKFKREFAAEWIRVCRMLKESGRDLSKIAIIWNVVPDGKTERRMKAVYYKESNAHEEEKDSQEKKDT